jgi:hypothetical protein
MTVKLINSAMMPQEGSYRLTKITQEVFCRNLRRAAMNNDLESFIGYPDTALFIERISEVTIHVNREQTTLVSGDTVLICKLKYRLPDPSIKGKFTPTDDDYEFFLCTYYN